MHSHPEAACYSVGRQRRDQSEHASYSQLSYVLPQEQSRSLGTRLENSIEQLHVIDHGFHGFPNFPNSSVQFRVL